MGTFSIITDLRVHTRFSSISTVFKVAQYDSYKKRLSGRDVKGRMG